MANLVKSLIVLTSLTLVFPVVMSGIGLDALLMAAGMATPGGVGIMGGIAGLRGMYQCYKILQPRVKEILRNPSFKNEGKHTDEILSEDAEEVFKDYEETSYEDDSLPNIDNDNITMTTDESTDEPTDSSIIGIKNDFISGLTSLMEGGSKSSSSLDSEIGKMLQRLLEAGGGLSLFNSLPFILKEACKIIVNNRGGESQGSRIKFPSSIKKIVTKKKEKRSYPGSNIQEDEILFYEEPSIRSREFLYDYWNKLSDSMLPYNSWDNSEMTGLSENFNENNGGKRENMELQESVSTFRRKWIEGINRLIKDYLPVFENTVNNYLITQEYPESVKFDPENPIESLIILINAVFEYELSINTDSSSYIIPAAKCIKVTYHICNDNLLSSELKSDEIDNLLLDILQNEVVYPLQHCWDTYKYILKNPDFALYSMCRINNYFEGEKLNDETVSLQPAVTKIGSMIANWYLSYKQNMSFKNLMLATEVDNENACNIYQL